MTTKSILIFQRREISMEEAAKEAVDAFGPPLPGVRPTVEIIREEVTV